MNHYKMVELTEGEYVQFVGVHALKWRPEWGKPEVGFIEEDYDDPPSPPKSEERNAELVEALHIICNRLEENLHHIPQEYEGVTASVRYARAVLAKEAAND